MSSARDRRRKLVKRILLRRKGYQFGQPKDDLVGDGRVACTDTCIQLIVLIVKGWNVSLNNVRRRSKAAEDQPMQASEALRALRSYGLPYVVERGLTARQVMRIAMDKGPVIVCEMYWAHPQWKGYSYAGRTLNGYAGAVGVGVKRVGFAKPTGRAGLTQWPFRGGHAILAATAAWQETRWGRRLFGFERDPNHSSAVRPERPAWDKVNLSQLQRQLDSWPGESQCYVPTRRII
jgi:hypothetical protein